MVRAAERSSTLRGLGSASIQMSPAYSLGTRVPSRAFCARSSRAFMRVDSLPATPSLPV